MHWREAISAHSENWWSSPNKPLNNGSETKFQKRSNWHARRASWERTRLRRLAPGLAEVCGRWFLAQKQSSFANAGRKNTKRVLIDKILGAADSFRPLRGPACCGFDFCPNGDEFQVHPRRQIKFV